MDFDLENDNDLENEDEELEDIRGLLDSQKPSILTLIKRQEPRFLPIELFRIWDYFITLPNGYDSHGEFINQKIAVLSYALQPLPFLENCGIMVFQGISGTGKSEHTKLISKLYDVNLLTNETTKAALRNAMSKNRFPMLEPYEMDGLSNDEIERNRFLKKREQLSLIIFEDYSIDKINEIFSILKSGCNRETDQIENSLGNGKNAIFRTFIPKLFSTIQPIYGQGVLMTDELRRRMIVIKHEKPTNLDQDFLKVSSFNYNEIYSMLNKFWRTSKKVKQWVYLTEELSNYQIKIHIESKDYYLELIKVSLICGFFKTIEDSISYFERFYEYQNLIISDFKSTLIELLEILIIDKAETFRNYQEYSRHHSNNLKLLESVLNDFDVMKEIYQDDNLAFSKVIPIQEIKVSVISENVLKWSSLNMIRRPSDKELKDAMASLGFTLNTLSLTYQKFED